MAEEDFQRKLLREILEVVKELKTLNEQILRVAQNTEVLARKEMQKRYSTKE
jgi:hypothetical protein